MKTRNQYVLTFSVRKLTELLEEAGFDIRPGADIRGGLVQIISTPAEQDVFVEWSGGPGMPWERVTGTEQRQDRKVETAGTGQYL